MSFGRIAARLLLVQALKGNTLVGDNVRDSLIGGIDIAADGTVRTDQEGPFIAVYTDAAKTEQGQIDLRSLKENGRVEIVLEWGITAAMTETDPDTDESVIVSLGFPATDAAMEFHMDMVGRQIADILTDPDNAWSDLFRSLCYNFVQVDRSRVGNDGDGVRLAAHQMKITAELLDDPIRGETIEGVFARIFTALDTSGDTDLVARSALMQAQLAGTNEPWELTERYKGMTDSELLALGIGPIADDADRSTPPFGEGAVDIPEHTSTLVTE